MTTTTIYNIDGRELENFMAKYGSEMVLAWLCGNRLSSETVCNILKVSRCTLSNYIKAGRLTVLNEGERAHEFDLSDVIRLFLVRSKKISRP